MSNCKGCVCGGNCAGKQPQPEGLSPGTEVYLKRYRQVGVISVGPVGGSGSVVVEGVGPVPIHELQAIR